MQRPTRRLGGFIFSAHRWALAALTLLSSLAMAMGAAHAAAPVDPLSDEALAQSLPGSFENGFADVNGKRLHYVPGGSAARCSSCPVGR